MNPLSHIPNPNESHIKNFLMRDGWQHQFIKNSLELVDNKPAYSAKHYEQLIALAATSEVSEDGLVEIQTGVPFDCDMEPFQKDNNAFIYFNICDVTDGFNTHYTRVSNDTFISKLELKDQKNGLRNLSDFRDKVLSRVDHECSIRFAIVSDFAVLLGAINYYQQNRDWLTSTALLEQVINEYEFFAVGHELRIAILDSKHNYLSWLLAEAQYIVDNVVKYPLAV